MKFTRAILEFIIFDTTISERNKGLRVVYGPGLQKARFYLPTSQQKYSILTFLI